MPGRVPQWSRSPRISSASTANVPEAGMDGHMAKPVELSHLRELIDHWVRVKQAEHAE